MKTIQFQAEVGPDQVIRPPAGIVLPQDPLEVMVHRLPGPPDEKSAAPRPRHVWLLELAEEAERLHPGLPQDVAEHHDH